MKLLDLHPKKIVEFIVFNARWLLIPFLLRLIYNLIVMMIHFVYKGDIGTQDLIDAIGALDVMMIAVLIEMVITGSYNSSIAKDHGYKGKNISSGTLKIKMGTSLIGVSSVHLLKVFVADTMANAHPLSQQDFWRKIIIHMAFIVGGIFLAIIDNILTKSEVIEAQMEKDEKEEEEKDHELKTHIHEKILNGNHAPVI